MSAIPLIDGAGFYMSGTQTVLVGGNFTFPSTYSTSPFITKEANNQDFTIHITGKYYITCLVFEGTTSGQILITRNNVPIPGGGSVQVPNGATNIIYLDLTIELNAGDVIRINNADTTQVTINLGGNQASARINFIKVK